MRYLTRLALAGVFSALLHVLLLGLALRWAAVESEWLRPEPEPLVLNIAPEPEPEEPPMRRLVDPVAPSEAPEVDTENIAAFDASAAADTEESGEERGPDFEEESEQEILTPAPEPPPESAPEPTPAMEAEPESTLAPAPEAAPEIDAAPETPVESAEPSALPPESAPQPEPEPVEPATPSENEETHPEAAPESTREAPPLPEPFHTAQAETAPQPTPEDTPPNTGRSRGLQNEVRNRGFTNFDAIQDELAPYLQEIKRQVERRWNEALLTRYSGSSPMMATVDCAIAPDGSLVSVDIVGAPRDALFAALCRDAIERAGPFGAFPFEVPDLYRNQNLEIRWTFNFL